MHVGAHPHIGLQTFTWLIEGKVLHRDSLGNEQVIRPGQVNLMTAGHGIAHTEDSLRDGERLHAAQLWIALPPEHKDCPPAFDHYAELPRWREGSAELTLLAGRYGKRTAAARIHSPLVGIDIACDSPGNITLELDPGFEYGLMPLVGDATIYGETIRADELAYLGKGRSHLKLALPAGARVLFLGGEPFEEPVLMWWNFVGFSKADIAQAQTEWNKEPPDSERSATARHRDWLHRPSRGETAVDRSATRPHARHRRLQQALDLRHCSKIGQRSNLAGPQRLD